MNFRLVPLAVCVCVIAGCGDKASGSKEPADAPPTQTTGTTKTDAPSAEPKLGITDVTPGTGRPAETGDKVWVEYTGKLKNGTQFDSNAKQKKDPLVVVIGSGAVIEGWEKGLVGMKVGGERKLVIPPELGYGSNEQNGIPPNSELHFDVKILAMVKQGEDLVIDTKDTKPGAGARVVKQGDTVTIHYVGMLPNGKIFDSSRKRGKPLTFKVGAAKVVSGMEEGVKGMKLGGLRRIMMPPETNYGGMVPPGGSIQPNSYLFFDVELLSIK